MPGSLPFESVEMTPERATKLLSLKHTNHLRGEVPRSFVPVETPGYQPHPEGMTILEEAFVRKIWITLPSKMTERDALVRIAKKRGPAR